MAIEWQAPAGADAPQGDVPYHPGGDALLALAGGVYDGAPPPPSARRLQPACRCPLQEFNQLCANAFFDGLA
jgi:hypothetical protein